MRIVIPILFVFLVISVVILLCITYHQYKAIKELRERLDEEEDYPGEESFPW